MKERNSGFTLVEVVVVLAVVAILAAILTPNIVKNIKDSKIARAANETQVIAGALASFYKDLGRWPTSRGNNANNNDFLYLLVGDGTVPGNSGANSQQWRGGGGWGGARMDTFVNHLIENDPKDAANNYPVTGDLKWAGPYIIKVKADPWGNHYSCNIAYTWFAGGNTNGVGVLSAGPDRTFNTRVNQPMATFTVLGDDIITRIQ
jgi:prepilin-type N-terminal cleavage/methylation domain-containing protein